MNESPSIVIDRKNGYKFGFLEEFGGRNPLSLQQPKV